MLRHLSEPAEHLLSSIYGNHWQKGAHRLWQLAARWSARRRQKNGSPCPIIRLFISAGRHQPSFNHTGVLSGAPAQQHSSHAGGLLSEALGNGLTVNKITPLAWCIALIFYTATTLCIHFGSFQKMMKIKFGFFFYLKKHGSVRSQAPVHPYWKYVSHWTKIEIKGTFHSYFLYWIPISCWTFIAATLPGVSPNSSTKVAAK